MSSPDKPLSAAELAELRELFDDDWPTRVDIETITDGAEDYCGTAACGPVHNTCDRDADRSAALRDMRALEKVPRLLDAAERCARLEALLEECSEALDNYPTGSSALQKRIAKEIEK